MNEYSNLPPGGMGPLDPTDIREPVKHSISIEFDPSILGGDTWSCACGADGDDMYDLASHFNEVTHVLPA